VDNHAGDTVNRQRFLLGGDEASLQGVTSKASMTTQ
jgi:hypothetical protein